MLVDLNRHRKWSAFTVAAGLAAWAVFAVADRNRPGGLTGGSLVGLWLGLIGTTLMVYAALLSALRLFPDRLRKTSWRVVTPFGLGALLFAAASFVSRYEIGGAGTAGRLLRGVVLSGSALATTFGVLRLLQVGSRRAWLRGHLWLGLLSGWFILLHSGFHLGGVLEQVLWGLLAATLMTGVYGLALQQFLPRMITSRVPCEVPVGQHDHVCRLIRHEADALIETLCGVGVMTAVGGVDAEEAIDVRDRLREFYDRHARGFLTVPYDATARLAAPQAAEAEFAALRRGVWMPEDREQLNRLETLCEQRRLLGEQDRLHRRLHRWLWWHIPVSAALLVLGLVHAVMSVYY